MPRCVEEEAAAKAAADAAAAVKAAEEEKAKIEAEREELEREIQRRAETCAFEKRERGATGFVEGPFQTSDGNVAAPFVLLW